MFSAQIFCHLFNSMEGEMGAYDIAVLSLFSSGISVIWILKWVIVISFSPAVCGFSSFWLTVFSKRKSFTVLWYCSLRSPV